MPLTHNLLEHTGALMEENKMAFPKLKVKKYPKRKWEIRGRADSGKSTFLTQMRSPILPIDADHRIDQVAKLNPDMLQLSYNAEDHNNTDRIAELLDEHMPGTKVGTIGVDSLTAIITPLVTQGMIDKANGNVQNGYSAFQPKALAMRQLQDAVTKWGTDVLWIYHLDDSTNASGKKTTHATITDTELARLMRSVNMKLEVVVKDGKRGIKVLWARDGRWGNKVDILWDTSGKWEQMPERIEAAVYDGLSEAEQAAIENELPEVFPDDATAIGWGLEYSVWGSHAFEALEHARNAYEKLMRENDEPETMEERTALWVADVHARAEAKLTPSSGNGSAQKQPVPVAPAKPITSTEFWERAIALGMRNDAQIFIKANTVDRQTNWSGALADLERKVAARV